MPLRLHAYILVIVTLLGTPLMLYAQTPETISRRSIDSSQLAFRRAIQNPRIAEAFRQMQRSFLNLEGDQIFQMLFNHHPLANEIYKAVGEVETQRNQFFKNLAVANMVELSADISVEVMVGDVKTKVRYLQSLDTAIREAAAHMGFSDQAIANRRIFLAPGDSNAFTVSGNDQEIIVVVNSGLIERHSLDQLKAIMGHELGHIRSEHTRLHVMHSLVLTLIDLIYIKGASNSAEMFSQVGAQSSWLPFLETFEHGKAWTRFHQSAQPTSEPTSSQRRRGLNNLSPLDLILARVMDHIGTQDSAQIDKLFADYLGLAVQVLKSSRASPDAITYFNELQTQIASHSNLRLDARQFHQNAGQLLSAYSRTAEFSADRYAASISRNEVMAEAFAVLNGVTELKKVPQLKSAILNSLLAQAQHTLALPPEQLAQIIGNTHPAFTLRVAAMLGMEKIPTVLMANPFLRMVALYTTLEANLSLTQTLIEQRMLDPKDLPGNLPKTLQDLRLSILDLILSVGFKGKFNPRATNLIQFFSLQREAYLIQLEELKRAPETPETAKAIRGIEQRLSQAPELLTLLRGRLRMEISSPDFKDAGESPNRLAQSLLNWVEKVLSSTNLAELQAQRTEWSKGPNGKSKSTQLPLDIQSDVNLLKALPGGSAGLCHILK